MKNKRGFTILELTVVICLLGILATLAAPAFTGILMDARKYQCDRNIEIMSSVYQGEKERDTSITLKEIVENEGGLYFAERFSCSGQSYMIREQLDRFEIFCPAHGGVVVDEIARNMVDYYEKAVKRFSEANLKSSTDVWAFMRGENSKFPSNPTERELELLEQYKNYNVQGNDGLRLYLFVFHYNGAWPTLDVPKENGSVETLYVQPYCAAGWGDNSRKEDIIVYANGRKELNSPSWVTDFIFNKDNGQWYQKKMTGTYVVSGKTWEQVKADLMDTDKFKIYEGTADF